MRSVLLKNFCLSSGLMKQDEMYSNFQSFNTIITRYVNVVLKYSDKTNQLTKIDIIRTFLVI